MLAAGEIATPFVFGDLRRTATTTFPSIGINDEVGKQIQSHDLGGVTMKHYMRFDYMKQKLEALEKWESHLAGLANLPTIAKSRIVKP